MGVLYVKLDSPRLHAFRLTEVPEHLRRKHGERLVGLAYQQAHRRGLRGYDLLMATVAAKQAITKPSATTYRIPVEAYEAVMA
jgi:hypothetical protein